MTAYETLQAAVATWQAKLDKDKASLSGWQNDPTYLLRKSDGKDPVYVATVEAKIAERTRNVADDQIALDAATKRVADYENSSPVIKADIATKAAAALQQADTRRTLWIVGGILGLGLMFWAIITSVKKKPQTT